MSVVEHDLEHAGLDDVTAQLRHRRAVSWRCAPLADGRRDPLDPVAVQVWTYAELAAWRAAWRHLRRAGYPAVVPASVLDAGRCDHCPCCRTGAA